MKKFNILLALVVALSLFFAPSYMVEAKKSSKKTETKAQKKEKKKTSVFDKKTNSVVINLDGYQNRENIKLSIYEKQDNGKYKKVKTVNKKSVKGDTFKFKQALGEKSDFDYGKTYKYKITSKECYVEEKTLNECFSSDYSLDYGNNKIFSNKTNQRLSDGDRQNFKNCGKILIFKNKKCKSSKTFKTITKQKRLLEFSKTYKKVVYSQAKRHQKGFADCSSFVYACYKNVGMHMGGDGANTETELAWCEKNALKVKFGSAKLGDVIFYSDESVDTFEDHYKHVTHVAMFKSNDTIMEMGGKGKNFTTRKITAFDRDCIAVYRPIYDAKDMKDKDNHKQNLKKSKKEKEKKYLKKHKKELREAEKKTKKKKKKQPAKETANPTDEAIKVEEETGEGSSW